MSEFDVETFNYIPFVSIHGLLRSNYANPAVSEALSSAIEGRKHLLTPTGWPRASATASLKAPLQLNNGFQVQNISEREIKYATEASSRFDLDVKEALVLLRSFEVLKKGPREWKTESEFEEDSDWWLDLETFYFDERINAIKLLVSILTSRKWLSLDFSRDYLMCPVSAEDDLDASPALVDYLSKLAQSFFPKTFSKNVLDAYLKLSNSPVPSIAATDSRHTTAWSKQFAREQYEWLELLFCYWYQNPASGTEIKTLLDAIEKSDWGAKQAASAYYDAEARIHSTSITCTLIALSIVCLSLENIVSIENTFELPLASSKLPPVDSLLHPNLLLSTHNQVVKLAAAFPNATAPFAASWAYILSRITESLSRGEIAAEYTDFIQDIQSTPQNAQPFWQRLLSHVLSFVFPTLTAAMPTATASRASILGVLTCHRAVFALMPSMLSLSFLSEEQCTCMTDFAVALYGHPEAAPLRAHFWTTSPDTSMSDDVLSEGEKELLDLHSRRFPFQPAPLLSLLKALSGGNNFADTASAHAASTYLRSLAYLTSFVVKGSALGGLPYEISTHDQTIYRVVKPAPGLRISESVYVPQYTHGLLVSSGSGKEGVVQWDFTSRGWNGWLFVIDLLHEYAMDSVNAKRQKPVPSKSVAIDPFAVTEESISPTLQFASTTEREQAVADALDLFARDAVASRISGKEADGKSQLIFNVLENSVSTGSRHVAAAALRALSGLLSLQPGVIWSMLRSGRGDLFVSVSVARGLRGGSALLKVDRNLGSYEAIIALLDFVTALILEMQRSPGSEEHLHVKAEVLKQALHWIQHHVWSADFITWRFQEARDRWHLASQLCRMWSLIAQDCLLGEKGNLGGAADFFLETMLASANEPTISIGSVTPLISTISHSYDSLQTSIKAGRDLDITASEKCLQDALQLVLSLLIVRKHHRQSPSHCEELLLCHTTSNSPDRPLLEPTAAMLTCITNHHALQDETVILACQSLAALSILSFDFQATAAGFQSLLPTFSRPERQFAELADLVEDIHLSNEIRLAVLDLLTAFVSSQPALAVLIISGKLSSNKTSAVRERTILTTVVNQMKRSAANSLEPVLQEASLRFLVAAWQQALDHLEDFETVRSDSDFWESVLRIASSRISIPIFEDMTILDGVTLEAHAALGKAYAAKLVATDIEIFASFKSKKGAALTGMQALMSDLERLKIALGLALENSLDSSLHQATFESIKNTFRSFDLSSTRKAKLLGHPCLDVNRQLGSQYVFDESLTYYKLSSLTRKTSDVDRNIYSLLQVNTNWSLADAQLSVTKAWSELLAIATDVSLVTESKAQSNIGQVCLEAASSLLPSISSETQGGDLITTIHAARLSVVVRALEAASVRRAGASRLLLQMLDDISGLFRHDSLDPFDSLEHKSAAPFHRDLHSALYLLLNICLATPELTAKCTPKDLSSLTRSLQCFLKYLCHALRSLLYNTRPTSDSLWETDVAMVVNLFRQCLAMPQAPVASVWLSMCTEDDLLRLSLQLVLSTPIIELRKVGASGSACRHMLSWLLCISAHPMAAERMAVENLLGVLASCSFVHQAQEGNITVREPGEEERSEIHRVWCLTLALVARLANVLASSSSFLAEVCGFVRLTLPQQLSLYEWSPSDSLPVPALEEMEVTCGLYSVISRTAPSSEACIALRKPIMIFLNALIHALQHPNTVASSLEPCSVQERTFLDQLANEPSSSTDYSLASVTGPLIQSLISVTSTIVDALAISFQSYDVLRKDETLWPFDNALFYPTAKFAIQKPASIGSLIDLSEWCFDQLRHHAGSKTADDPVSRKQILPPFDKDLMKNLAALTLEASLLLAVTQMALAFYRPILFQNADQTKRVRSDIASELAPEVLSRLAKTLALQRSHQIGSDKLILSLHRFIQLRMK